MDAGLIAGTKKQARSFRPHVVSDAFQTHSAEPLEQSQFTVQMLKAGTPVGTPKTVNGLGTGTIILGNNAGQHRHLHLAREESGLR